MVFLMLMAVSFSLFTTAVWKENKKDKAAFALMIWAWVFVISITISNYLV